MNQKEEPLQFHPNPEELWKEYHRVIAPVIVYNIEDENADPEEEE